MIGELVGHWLPSSRKWTPRIARPRALGLRAVSSQGNCGFAAPINARPRPAPHRITGHRRLDRSRAPAALCACLPIEGTRRGRSRRRPGRSSSISRARSTSGEPQRRRQPRQRRSFAVRRARQSLARLASAVAPDRPHAECRGGMDVPGVGRLEGDPCRGHADALDGALIDARVRLEDADFLDRNRSRRSGRPTPPPRPGRRACQACRWRGSRCACRRSSGARGPREPRERAPGQGRGPSAGGGGPGGRGGARRGRSRGHRRSPTRSRRGALRRRGATCIAIACRARARSGGPHRRRVRRGRHAAAEAKSKSVP